MTVVYRPLPGRRPGLLYGRPARLASVVSGLCLTLCALAFAHQAKAVETHLSVVTAPPELTAQLEAASASMALGPEQDVQEIIAAALSDYRTMVQVLYDQGFFAPVVQIRLDGREAARLDLLNPPLHIKKLEISVTPGPAFVFGRAEVTPLPKGAEATLPEGFATDKPASTGMVQAAATAGLTAWDTAGYPKVTLSRQDITANALQKRLNASLRLAPGPQLRLGQLRIVGASDVRRTAIQSIAGFASGEIYHPDLITTAANRLRRTGAFSSVAVQQAKTPNSDGTLDFIAEVEDMPKRRFTFGGEISSSDGIEISSSWMHRNLFGAAERLKVDMSISGIGTSNIDGSLAARLDRPAALGVDRTLFYYGALEQLDEEHFTANSLTAAIGYQRVVSDTTTVEAGLGLQTIKADDAFGENRRFTYFAARLRGETDLRNIKTDATAGTYIGGEIVPFVGIEHGDAGVQVKLDARAYRSLGASDRVVLAGRAQIGSVIGPNADAISPTLLFFSGGAGSVRGQDYQSLGIDTNGKTAGGLSYLALSGELRGRVSNAISLVGFYDIGFIGAKSLITTDNSYHAGAGVGLRYNVTGIGPIRLDLAMPVAGDTTDGLQFYIGIGQAF